MKSVIRYVYVLRLENGGFYVGCTRHLAKRLAEHFEKGGAIATRESRPVAIEKIYQFEDCLFGKEPAHLRFEVFIASEYAKRHGIAWVKGAKHGRGWDSAPTRNDLRFIRRFRAFFQRPEGRRWLASVREIDLGASPMGDFATVCKVTCGHPQRPLGVAREPGAQAAAGGSFVVGRGWSFSRSAALFLT